MQQYHRFLGILVGAGISALITALAVLWSLHLPVTSARAAQLLSEKPISGWYVCRDLGIGIVPGVPDLRQRLQLCHDEGWIVNTYCTQPGLPVPPLGRSCTRIGEEKYSCGANYQLLREYLILATPVNTPTPNATPTQTITPPPVIATEIQTMTPSPVIATETQTITSTSILATETQTITPTSILTTGTQTITPPPVTTTETQTITPSPVTATETQTMTPPPVTATQKRPPRPPTGGEGNAAQVRTLVFTEISILTLAICIGIWFFRRLDKWD